MSEELVVKKKMGRPKKIKVEEVNVVKLGTDAAPATQEEIDNTVKSVKKEFSWTNVPNQGNVQDVPSVIDPIAVPGKLMVKVINAKATMFIMLDSAYQGKDPVFGAPVLAYYGNLGNIGVVVRYNLETGKLICSRTESIAPFKTITEAPKRIVTMTDKGGNVKEIVIKKQKVSNDTLQELEDYSKNATIVG